MSDSTTRLQHARLKQAHLLSSVGALVLGVGIGVMAAPALGPLAIPIFLLGCISHGWGMIMTYRIEELGQQAQSTWETYLYWGCWVALGIVAAFASWRALIHA